MCTGKFQSRDLRFCRNRLRFCTTYGQLCFVCYNIGVSKTHLDQTKGVTLMKKRKLIAALLSMVIGYELVYQSDSAGT